MTHSEFEMWNYQDKQSFDENKLTYDLQEVVNERDWTEVLTHNFNGEYGHRHHRQIHNIMKMVAREQASFFEFGDVSLSGEIWKKKLDLIKQHKSQQRVWSRFLFLARNEKCRWTTK